MGSSSLASFYLGRGAGAGSPDRRQRLVMVLIASALLAFVGIRSRGRDAALDGAEGSSSMPASPTCSGTPGSGAFAVLSMAFTALLRNDGRPGLTTWILVGAACSTCCSTTC